MGPAGLSAARAPAARDGRDPDRAARRGRAADVDALLALPGIGRYTAAAVASFAFGQRHAVLDTNVRRVLARLVAGRPRPASTPSVAELRMAESLLPPEPAVAARWSVAVMELGALVCTAASPRCAACPVARDCAWLAAGQPADPGVRRPAQRYDGTDRQCRGRLLGVLRESGSPAHHADFDAVWSRPGATGPGPGRAGRRRPGRPAAGRPLRTAGLALAESCTSRVAVLAASRASREPRPSRRPGCPSRWPSC